MKIRELFQKLAEAEQIRAIATGVNCNKGRNYPYYYGVTVRTDKQIYLFSCQDKTCSKMVSAVGLTLDTVKTVADEIVTVTFGNYLAHYFDHVMAGSILFDIEVVDLNRFIVEYKEELVFRKSFDWPIRYNDSNDVKVMIG